MSALRLSDLWATMGRLVALLDPDVTRSGLSETPMRAAKAWMEWTNGYSRSPQDILKTFEDGAEGCDEMIVVSGIPVYSHCEHHLAPIFGTAIVGYLPNKRIVGLSKLPRLVDMYARRLQVQERMTNQIAMALMEHLQPLGCGVVIRARHFCIESRGIKQPSSMTTTCSLHGAFKNDARTRSEFLALANKE
jgi:GTP cyclohydrolase I